jgi:hypothetical protein
MTAQILIVDDEPDMKALVLQKFRHQIADGAINFLFASDGIEACRGSAMDVLPIIASHGFTPYLAPSLSFPLRLPLARQFLRLCDLRRGHFGGD